MTEDIHATLAGTALIRSGLACDSPAARRHVTTALNAELAAPIALRKLGTLLTAQQKQEAGIRPNTVITMEFWSILNENGRLDPIEAASAIFSLYRGALGKLGDIARLADVGFTLVDIIPNNMASGPCDTCIALARKPIALAEAPIFPPAECPHPTQCSIRFSAHYDLSNQL